MRANCCVLSKSSASLTVVDCSSMCTTDRGVSTCSVGMSTASDRQKSAPRVFGMISEKYRIASVSSTAIRVSHLAPKTRIACVPTPKAPMVCAKVLRIRMAASDWSSRSRTRATAAPASGRSSLRVATKLGVVESSTASSIEHRNDTPMAMAK